MATLFISDLHLNEKRLDLCQAFFDFMSNQAKHAEALYILGDFFDAWIGDDDDRELGEKVADAIAKLVDHGVPVFIMHGNRDFLLGEAFCQKAKATLLKDPSVINLYGKPTLLMHGDSLCIDDQAYQAFRQQVRSDTWQQQVLSQPLAVRRLLAEKLRSESTSMNSNKASDIMDASPIEIERVMELFAVKQLIHGHTHRPAIHTTQLPLQGEAYRYVIGDWDEYAWCLEADAEGIRELRWEISQ